MAAIKNYNGGVENAKYHRLLQEYNRFQALEDPYAIKARAVEGMLRSQIPQKIHPLLTEDEKKNKFLYFLCCLQHLHLITSPLVFWNTLPTQSADGEALKSMSVNVLQILNQAAYIERINKNSDMVHTKARASFQQSNVRKSIYCFTNLLLQQKVKLSYQDYCTTVLTPEDADDVARTFEMEADSSDDELPVGDAHTTFPDTDEDEDVSEPVIVVSRKVFECPPGFTALEKPTTFLSGSEALKDLFVLMLWKVDGWELGKVKKFAPQRVRHNFDILWQEGVRGSKLSLDDYVDLLTLEVQLPGSWAYVRKEAT
ncbi:hypothetical protein CYMTET_8956 [Cymbomonas tetramitiformis]|uniref:Uncharacterized protein n=1 Tax=Cymbomonas tetramitiformis TaxID=36881 RepID=A0AAE0GSP9_9CHLO|nr:hypothetical protein CYMTET_8956 [Cymbomonas tetramitiformis]